MIRTFNVVLNGKPYHAEIEETTQTAAAKAAASMPLPKAGGYAPAPASVSASAPVPVPVASAQPAVSAGAGGAVDITVPLPSTVYKLCVKEGEHVKKGQLIAVLEAMKMENEVFSSATGVVRSIALKEGASANAGDVLMTIG